MPIQTQDSGRGPVFQNGSHAWHSPDGAIGFGDDPIRNALTRLAVQEAAFAAELKPELVYERLWQAEGGMIRAGWRGAHSAASDEATAAARADLTFRTPVEPVDPAIAAWVWSRWSSMDAGSQGKALVAANLVTTTALTAWGNQAGLNDQLFDAATARFRELNWLRKAHLEAVNPRQPSLERIVVTGPDHAAAQAQARQELAAHDARMQAVEANERTARALVDWLAGLFRVAPQAMLDRLQGRAA